MEINHQKQWIVVTIAIFILCLINFIINLNLSSVSNENTLDTMTSRASTFLLLLTFGIFVPIIEECIFRGFIIKGVLEGSHYWLYNFYYSFTLAHNPTNIWEYLIFGFSSIVYVVSFMKTQRLEVPILIHILNNILGVLI